MVFFTAESFGLAFIEKQGDRYELVTLPIVQMPQLPHETARNILELLESRLFSLVLAASVGEYARVCVKIRTKNRGKKINALLTRSPGEALHDRWRHRHST